VESLNRRLRVAINWGGEEVRENPMGDEEVREMKRQRVKKPMGDEELREMERRGGGGGGEWEMKR
jgi:non-canonical (house-cleaning) NTP pyrophosphatase